MLLTERVSIAICHVDVINYLNNRMGVAEQVKSLTPYLTEGWEHYIVFSKAKGHDVIAKQFLSAMKSFKSTIQYRDLLKKYGLE